MSLLKSLEHIFLPPRTEALIFVKLTNKAAESFHNKHALIEPFITAGQRGFCVAKALVNKPDTNKLLCRILNPFDKLCKISRNYIVGTLTSVELTRDERDTNNTHHFALHNQFAGHSSTTQTSDRIRPIQPGNRLVADNNTGSLKTCVGRTAGWHDNSLQRRQSPRAENCKQQTVGPEATSMTDSLRHVGSDGRHDYCTGTNCAKFVNTEIGLQHSTGRTDGAAAAAALAAHQLRI